MTDPSGRILLRLPVGLHRQLADEAEGQGVSLNTLLVALLAGGAGFQTDGSPLRLTDTQARVLWLCAGQMEADLDSTALTAAEKRTFDPAMRKLRSAFR